MTTTGSNVSVSEQPVHYGVTDEYRIDTLCGSVDLFTYGTVLLSITRDQVTCLACISRLSGGAISDAE